MQADPVVQQFVEKHADNVARLLEYTEPHEMRAFMETLSTEQVAGIIRHLDRHSASHYLATLGVSQAVDIITILPAQYAATLVRGLPAPQKKALLAGKGVPYRFKAILRYPKGSVGAEMDSNPVSLNKDMTVKQARAFLKKYRDHIYDALLVTGSEQLFAGVIALKELLVADNTAKIASMCQPAAYQLSPRDALAAVVGHPAWQQVSLLPVVERGGRLSGMLRRDRVQEVMNAAPAAPALAGDITDGVFSLGELFWTTCADMLSGYDASASPERP